MAKVTIFFCFLLAFTANCVNNNQGDGAQDAEPVMVEPTSLQQSATRDNFRPAANDLARWTPLIQDQRVALLVNQTSALENGTHLVDTLKASGHNLIKIFAPEHGFRGDADAGAVVADGRDIKTGLPIKSLYGKNKKPTKEDLADVDVVVFDIQDVGARFYTYISTLYYLMESAARYDTKVIVLDRPNPNGHYVDGPLLEPDFQSFVGIASLPVVHGLTVGEFAKMVNGEGWLPDGLRADLTVVDMPNYRHDAEYVLPIPPSPNLPNQRAIYLYPSLCFFEGTVVSVGRGTDRQFQVYGHPDFPFGDIYFTPTPGPGSKNPKLEGQRCRGEDGEKIDLQLMRQRGQIDLAPLYKAYLALSAQDIELFSRPDFFDLLAGSSSLRESIQAGLRPEEIRESWQPGLEAYREKRQRYLLYP
jgi:uncharacterized protein YbbC (DUF1343 family)